LKETKITDAALEHLSGLANLQTLNLTGTQITDAGVRHLAGLTRLRKLLLAATSVSDAALMHLASLAQLDELNLHNTQVTDALDERVIELVRDASRRRGHTGVDGAGLRVTKKALATKRGRGPNNSP